MPRAERPAYQEMSMMDLSNSSWMTTKGRFRHVSWKASERVKPPRSLGSEPPPDKEPRSSCADTQGHLQVRSAHHQDPSSGPQPAGYTQPGQGDGCTHTTPPVTPGGSARPLEQGWCQGHRGGGGQGRSQDSTASGKTSPLGVPRLCRSGVTHLTGSHCPGPGPGSLLLTAFFCVGTRSVLS